MNRRNLLASVLAGVCLGLARPFSALEITGRRYRLQSDYLALIVSDAFIPRIADAHENASVILSCIPLSGTDASGKFITERVPIGRSSKTFFRTLQ